MQTINIKANRGYPQLQLIHSKEGNQMTINLKHNQPIELGDIVEGYYKMYDGKQFHQPMQVTEIIEQRPARGVYSKEKDRPTFFSLRCVELETEQA